MAYKIDPELCISCGTCIEECPIGAISDGDVSSIDPELCICCGTCAAFCPVDAITLCEDISSSVDISFSPHTIREDKRDSLQNWYDGRDGLEPQTFIYESGDTWLIGIEISGIIYYGYPTNGKMIISMVDEQIGELVKNLYDMSKVRVDTLTNYCPTIVRLFMDAVNKRYDTAAVVTLGNTWSISVVVDNFDFDEKLKEHGQAILADSIIVNKVLKMIELRKKAIHEINNWSGFTTTDEIKIAAKEMLPGAKVGYTIGKILSGGLI